uniref:Uncharacterized protein n=1 Tax=Arundo donax TaxID=35708 RepID=A0A0A9AIL2_ARUDO
MAIGTLRDRYGCIYVSFRVL